MQYRLANLTDLPTLERLWRECRPAPDAAAAFAATVVAWVNNDLGCVLVAVADGEPGGMLTAHLVPAGAGEATLQVLDLLVHPAYRYSGVAGQLLQEAAVQAREHGIGTLTISVDPTSPAVDLFAALGFRPRRLSMTYEVGAAVHVRK